MIQLSSCSDEVSLRSLANAIRIACLFIIKALIKMKWGTCKEGARAGSAGNCEINLPLADHFHWGGRRWPLLGPRGVKTRQNAIKKWDTHLAYFCKLLHQIAESIFEASSPQCVPCVCCRALETSSNQFIKIQDEKVKIAVAIHTMSLWEIPCDIPSMNKWGNFMHSAVRGCVLCTCQKQHILQLLETPKKNTVVWTRSDVRLRWQMSVKRQSPFERKSRVSRFRLTPLLKLVADFTYWLAKEISHQFSHKLMYIFAPRRPTPTGDFGALFP